MEAGHAGTGQLADVLLSHAENSSCLESTCASLTNFCSSNGAESIARFFALQVVAGISTLSMIAEYVDDEAMCGSAVGLGARKWVLRIGCCFVELCQQPSLAEMWVLARFRASFVRYAPLCPLVHLALWVVLCLLTPTRPWVTEQSMATGYQL